MPGYVRFIVCLTLLVMIVNEGCHGQNEFDKSSSDYIDSEVDLLPTYRSGVEKLLQGLMKTVADKSSSSSREAGSGGLAGIGRFINSRIPKPVKTIFEPVEKRAARGFGDILNIFKENFHAIFPGTRWCGGGNIASNEEDVGLFKETDSCCRAHDKCPSSINASDTHGRLINNGIFTRSACSCDEEFYNCLKNVRSLISANIGTTYFNILRPQCFSNEYPIQSCAKYERNRLVNKKCIEYNLDKSKSKTLEWFDSPDF